MLSTTLITLATFLLESCSSSPVYNMQPAFITNTVGITTGRNIRNLPCISRRNLNQHGVCMFAIDCLKANGTHLGTCIDRFYFGSCCHIEPVPEIFDNSIDTDILPHREPPMRITSTTRRPPTTLPTVKNETFTLISSSTVGTLSTTILPTTEKTRITPKPSSTSTTPAFGQRMNSTKPTTTEELTTSSPPVLTTISPETSSLPQKLQTFQVVDGNNMEEQTTRSPMITTKMPPVSSVPVTKKPVPGVSATSTRGTTSRPTSKPSLKPSTKPSATKSTARPRPITSSSATTKSPATGPTKSTRKPTKTSVTTKKPASSTVKVTKKPTLPTKPTRRTPVTTKRSTVKPGTSSTTTRSPTLTTAKPSKITTTVSVIKSSTTPQPKTTTVSSSSIPVTRHNSTTVVPLVVEESTRIPNETTTKVTVLATTLSNEVNFEEVNGTQVLGTVNGNLATNEIEGGISIEPVGPPVTSEPTDKPAFVTWTMAEEKNTSSTPVPGVEFNITGEWVPITTPDGWVLLPSVAPMIPPNDNITDSLITTSEPEEQTSSQSSTSTPSSLESSTASSGSISEHIFSTASPGVLNTTISESSEVSQTELPTFEVPSTDSSPSSMVTTTTMGDRPDNMSDFTHVCGRRMFPEARIVGGEKSSFGRWPWQISLRQWRTSTYLHKCGAALLNENWAITAAHCVDNVPPSDLLLRLGEHDLSTESEPYLHEERRVQIVASHPQFDPRTFEYDLALLRFYEPVDFQPNILPVCVPQTEDNFVGRNAWVTGWGRLYEDGPLPSLLQEVSVPIINNTVCESMYRSAGYIEHIPHIFICAGWRRGGFDSCEGDSGGPLVIQRDDNRFLLAGVISWGIGCAEPNQPGVYTRISEFRDWINQILQF